MKVKPEELSHPTFKKAKHTYEGYKPLTPEDIAEAVMFAATRNDNFVVAEMVVFPKAQAGVRDVVRKV